MNRFSACKNFFGKSYIQYSNQQTRNLNLKSYDVAIVGGGIVGLASAQELIHRYPEYKFVVLEKESKCNKHQTGHNSGVIHAGLYYKPGSLMAELCLEGLYSTYKYCDKHNLPYKKCGKIVVATNNLEVSRLRDLKLRAEANKVPELTHLKSLKEIQAVEPHCIGLEALWSPHTGIIDWGLISDHYGKMFEALGGEIKVNSEVNRINMSNSEEITLEMTNGDSIKSKYVLTCAGLYSDRVSMLTGSSSEPKIVPFRGEYLLLSEDKAKLIKGNIYPVPDPAFPFLGVHFTPRMNGQVWLGPNAVLATKREGYSWGSLSSKDLAEILSYPGFYKLSMKYVTNGIGEVVRSLFPRFMLPQLQKFVPEVTLADISKGPAGVRAQAMNTQGELIGDFVFDSSGDPRVLHCRNAPSPAATSSLAIGRRMADRVENQFGFSKRGNAALY